MATLTYPQLKAMVAQIVTTAKISNDTFTVTRDNLVGLVDKIGKIFDLDTNFRLDKLARFNSEYLSFGKTLEEWQADLILPEDYDATGAGAMTPHRQTFRPNFYSYTIGKKVIPQTIPYNDIERAVHNAGQYANIIARLYSRIEDSQAQYEYQLKREMAGKLAQIAKDAMDHIATPTGEYNGIFYVHDLSTASESATIASAYFTPIVNAKVGSVLSTSFQKRYVKFKDIPSDLSTPSYASLVADGYLVPLSLVSEVSEPLDATTGEDFLVEVKKFAEIASDRSQGNSLNGNALGVTTDLVLLVKQGVLPNLEVKTYAGAFHLDQLAVPAEVIALPDFGNADDDIIAIMLDGRGMGLYPTYNATRENMNGAGDFLNVFRHSEFTAHISRNTFVHVFVKASE